MTGKVLSKSALKLKCDIAADCSFFQKYKSKKSIVWLGMFSSYCCSEATAHCGIYQSRQKHGKFPHPDIMPTGKQVSPAFMSLP